MGLGRKGRFSSGVWCVRQYLKVVGRDFVSGWVFEGKIGCRRCGEEFAFLAEFVEKNVFREGAKQEARFLLGLYKEKGCFFIYSSFLAGKEAKEAGGTYEWFPLDPLSTSDGAKQR